MRDPGPTQPIPQDAPTPQDAPWVPVAETAVVPAGWWTRRRLLTAGAAAVALALGSGATGAALAGADVLPHWPQPVWGPGSHGPHGGPGELGRGGPAPHPEH